MLRLWRIYPRIWYLIMSLGNSNKAFTLAETLITLAIIGVVAAITIPSLMQSTQDAELKSAWKKAYAELSNATMQLANDNGGSVAGLCIGNGDHNCLRNLYKPYLKYQKLCDSGTGEGVCWSKIGDFGFLDGTLATSTDYNPAVYSDMILTNGSFVSFYLEHADCTTVSWYLTRCGAIVVDTNGFKKPNKFGKDMFRVHLLKNRIKPYGTEEDGVDNRCEGSTGSGSGLSCAAEYLKE